ncbi:MAG: exodeoxyribonuclease V subunit gamma [Candidatus Lambdaproteobacteria bacterium RIFOXYD1_FULL_56_27]|uniref:RecBCD enzyme subunit RecC n=1 Tax=Candidatus Lambdaproteobacteria bacterium RIFOXYD2_FULL_56_26 TaxID=1817773 RepID=A0A1F6H3C2_9PROT|nr:MAG: exodeoxyribonuclease V subunit gamma [Candidatus Lambdaproteobacteria bacterium RIFOXYC1_FULL_56_13]OGH04881.1 MAG: exodeoxyribonuclease V subunit gamma [Candidatus Lambdaproteobacteria bacterium RIFOXYD2_FULL_56_26]OGH09346.1 MAG: exodeoxyribonuclease V subunit gamma [Candidatus Lambdaproteobacteria bacterium RIFOXYD1_FULL_56_27]
MALFLHRSNRIESLFGQLAANLGEASADPFEKLWLVTQNPGMTKWLDLRLSERFGVWANGQVFFPKRLIERVLYLTLGQEVEGLKAWEPGTMTLALAERLAQSPPESALLREYLSKRPSSYGSLELAQRIAGCFDQYLVYRPDWVFDFEARSLGPTDNPTQAWQRSLWRSLVEVLGPHHWANLTQKAIAALWQKRPSGLPKRIDLFGLATLPPQFLELLQALGSHTELHLYLLTPTDQYWADLFDRKKSLKQELQAEAKAQAFEELFFDQSNSLLAFLGRMGQEFLVLIEEQLGAYDSGLEAFELPEPQSLVGRLQRDLRDLTQVPDQPEEIGPDQSLEVHRCHSPLREVQTAKNRILAFLEANPTAQPKDVAVLVSDLETYGPLVAAVFDQEPKLPYCVADRPLEQESLLVGSLLGLLQGAAPRYSLLEVLSWAEIEPIRQRFGFTPQDLDWIKTQLAEAGVRWGASGKQKAQLGQPEEPANSWEFGLKRLFWGYAIEPQELIQGVWPSAGVEGKDFDRLGPLADFWDAFLGLMERLEGEKTLAQWTELMGWVAETFLEPDSTEDWEWLEFRGLVEKLQELGPSPLALDKRGFGLVLQAQLGAAESGRGFLSNGVNLSGMKPMRSIPFPLVVMLGLGHRQFPGQVLPVSFDLTRLHPRLGDRSKKEDDKYLFLEALLAVRSRLVLCYQGQSAKDNSPLPPSVVVSELLDYLDQRYLLAGVKPSLALTVTQPLWSHDLLAFDPQEPRTASYSLEDWLNGQAILGPAPGRFLKDPLPALPLEQLELARLKAFFRDLIGGFFRFGLSLEFPRLEEALLDREPQEPGHLDLYQLREEILSRLVEGQDQSRILRQLQGQGLLPFAGEGLRLFGTLAGEVAPVFGRYRALLAEQTLGRRVQAQVSWPGLTLKGTTAKQPRVVCSTSEGHGKMLLGHWIDHLFANAALGPCETQVVARSKTAGAETFAWTVPQKPLELLAGLVEIYQEGLREPLPFFPKEGWEFIQKQKVGWVGQVTPKDLGTYQRAFGDLDLLSDPRAQAAQERFKELSNLIFGTMKEHLKEAP